MSWRAKYAMFAAVRFVSMLPARMFYHLEAFGMLP